MTISEMTAKLLDPNSNIIISRTGHKGCYYHTYTDELFHGTVGEYLNSEKTEFETRSEQYESNTIHENRMKTKECEVVHISCQDDCLVLFIEDKNGELVNE